MGVVTVADLNVASYADNGTCRMGESNASHDLPRQLPACESHGCVRWKQSLEHGATEAEVFSLSIINPISWLMGTFSQDSSSKKKKNVWYIKDDKVLNKKKKPLTRG